MDCKGNDDREKGLAPNQVSVDGVLVVEKFLAAEAGERLFRVLLSIVVAGSENAEIIF